MTLIFNFCISLSLLKELTNLGHTFYIFTCVVAVRNVFCKNNVILQRTLVLLDINVALYSFVLQVAEEEYLIQELRKIENRKKEREKKAQDLQKLIKAADTTTELRRAEKRVSKKKLPQKRETEKPVCSAHVKGPK